MNATYPVFVVCRDRLTYLTQLLDWLEHVGNADEVYLIDNDSTYPPLLDFYATTRHTVIPAGGNIGHKVGWRQGILRRYAAGRRFIYTDPDVLPVEDCPDDAIAQMARVLDSSSDIYKCGFSLKIDDLPGWCREGIVAWESRYWRPIDEWVNAYKAPIDTTFALHNPHAVRGFRYQPAYRLPTPYTARHLPWYTDPGRLSDEDEFYRVHADTSVSNWARYVMENVQ